METYQLDRILIWLASAIGLNENPEKKYFYDIKEKLFFNFGFTDNAYYQWTNQIPLSKEDSKTIQSKIVKLTEDRANFLEVCKSNTQFTVLPAHQFRAKEEYGEVENQWKFLHEQVQAFLTRHHIDLSVTRLIE